jgi:hypothetical protein
MTARVRMTRSLQRRLPGREEPKAERLENWSSPDGQALLPLDPSRDTEFPSGLERARRMAAAIAGKRAFPWHGTIEIINSFWYPKEILPEPSR